MQIILSKNIRRLHTWPIYYLRNIFLNTECFATYRPNFRSYIGTTKVENVFNMYTCWVSPEAHSTAYIYKKSLINSSFDIWLAVHHSITFLLLPTWYTNFLFIHINCIKLNSCTCFERNPPIIRSTTQIVHMQPLVSSLSVSDRLVQPLRKDFLSGRTRRSLAESDDTRGCICTICVVDLLMMGGLRSKHVEEFNLM